jgi:hypothetical protein
MEVQVAGPHRLGLFNPAAPVRLLHVAVEMQVDLFTRQFAQSYRR